MDGNNFVFTQENSEAVKLFSVLCTSYEVNAENRFRNIVYYSGTFKKMNLNFHPDNAPHWVRIPAHLLNFWLNDEWIGVALFTWRSMTYFVHARICIWSVVAHNNGATFVGHMELDGLAVNRFVTIIHLYHGLASASLTRNERWIRRLFLGSHPNFQVLRFWCMCHTRNP